MCHTDICNQVFVNLDLHQYRLICKLEIIVQKGCIYNIKHDIEGVISSIKMQESIFKGSLSEMLKV